MSLHSPGKAFRAALTKENPLQIVGTINANHALLAQRAGYQAIYLSGGGVAAGSLGLPDLGISTLDDVLTDIRRITDVCSLPLLVDADMDKKDVDDMMSDIDKVDGVKYTMGLESALGPAVPDEILPGEVGSIVKSDDYQLLIISSKYKVASDKVNKQIDEINQVVKQYDNKGMLIGEAPCTKDLIDITDRDFKVVSAISILAILLIIAFVLRSVSLPIILVAVIELAIFINMGIPYFTGTELPFIASICIGTIQLGSTVDYAILMTTRYKRERFFGNDKRTSVRIAHSTSMPSIMVSALGFFAATFGVAIYSDIDIISSLCTLMARGAVISMLVVMFILPSMFMLFDKLICKTSKGFINKDGNRNTGGKGAIPPIMDTAE